MARVPSWLWPVGLGALVFGAVLSTRRRAPSAPPKPSPMKPPPLPIRAGTGPGYWQAWAVKSDGSFEYMFSYPTVAELFENLRIKAPYGGVWYDFLLLKTGQIPNDTILRYGPYQPWASLWLYHGDDLGWAQKFNVELAEEVEEYLTQIGPGNYLYLQISG